MKLHRVLLGLFFVILICKPYISLGQSILNSFWGGCRNDRLNDFIFQRPFLYLAGSSNSFNWNGSDAYLCKLNSSGNAEWAITYSYQASNILYTSDNNLITIGYRNITKIDTNGTIIYSKTIPMGPSSIIQTYDKNILIAGGGQADLIKLDSGGNIIYSKLHMGRQGIVYEPPDGYVTINSILETRDSGFIATGYTAINRIDFPFILKTDKIGNIDWAKTYNKIYGLYSNGNIIDDNNKGYVICGNAEGASSPWPYDPFILKVNSIGDVIWSKVYRMNPSSISVRKVRINKALNGDFIISGTIGNDVFDNKTYYYAIRIDSLGDVIWSKKYGDSRFNICTSALIDGNSILLGGYSNDYKIDNNGSGYPNQTDMHLIRIDSSGNSVFHSENISLTTTDYIDGTIVNSMKDSIVYTSTNDVSNASRIVYSSYDSLTCISSGIKENNLYNEFSVFPNPIRSTAIIRFDNLRNRNISFKVYNSYGQLVNSISNITNDYVEFVRQNLVSGLYFFLAYDENKLIGIAKIVLE